MVEHRVLRDVACLMVKDLFPLLFGTRLPAQGRNRLDLALQIQVFSNFAPSVFEVAVGLDEELT